MLTIVGFPLASALPLLLDVDSQVVSVPFRVLVLLLAAAIAYGWIVRGTRIHANATLGISLLLWVLLLARMFTDTVIDPLPGSPGMPVSQFVALSLGACFLPALVFMERPSRRTLDLARRLIEGFGAVALLVLLYLGLQGLSDGQIFRRLSTDVLNPISVGHLGLSVFVVALSGLPASSGLARAIRSVLALLSLVVVVASVSRGPILGAIVIALVAAAVFGRRAGLSARRVVWRIFMIVGLVALFATMIVYLEESETVQVTARFADAVGDASGQERLDLFRGAWQQFASRPVFGDAYVELKHMSWPHNLVLESLMAAGAAGFLLLLLVLLGASLSVGRILLGEARYSWPALLLIQYFMALMFSGTMLLDGRFWAMLLAVLAMDRMFPAVGGLPGNQTQGRLAC